MTIRIYSGELELGWMVRQTERRTDGQREGQIGRQTEFIKLFQLCCKLLKINYFW